MSDFAHVMTAALAVAGAIVILLAMIGFVRMPDVYCRSHALGVAVTLGFGLLVAALWGELGPDPAGLKLLAAIVFQILTIPVSAHLLVLQARRSREGMEEEEGRD